MGDYDDYPHEHDRLYQVERSHEGGRLKSRDDGAGRDHRERDRYDREPPRDYDRRRDERDLHDRRDDDRRRPRGDDRQDRGPGGYAERRDFGDRRDYGERRDVRGDPREYGRERRRSRSRERRRSRSRDRYDNRRGDRDGGRRGRGGRGRREDHHSEEEEGYGGYKPRRRQAPPDPAKYDKPLPPGAGPGYISDPFYYLRQNVPTDPAEAQRLWLEQQLRSRQTVLQQQAASAAAASAKTQRELYIGNLVPGAVTDVALRQLFNTTLAAAFTVTSGAEPVVNVNLHSDGRYAFVEFRTPEMATAALALNGQVQLLGQTISVGRPSGYVDPHKASEAAQAAAQALAAFQAGDMAALAANATAAGMNLAQLGLANLILPKSAEGAAPAVTGAGDGDAAAAKSREATPAPGGGAPAGDQEQQKVMMQLLQSNEQDGDGQEPPDEGKHQPGLPEQPPAAGAAADAGQANGGGEPGDAVPTPFFCVLGMLSADMLADDEEYEAVIDDLADECSRHAPGGLVAVKVPRPPEDVRTQSTDWMGSGNYGKAFVAFKDGVSSQRARAAIHGRLFAGSTVTVQYISEEDFAAVP